MDIRILEKTDRKDPASIAEAAENGESSAKAHVIASRTFREGRIYLYQRSDFKKPTWLCRVKVPNGKGYVTRSSGTWDENEAFKFASNLYDQLLVKSLTGEAPPGKRIGPVIDAYVKRLEAESGRRSIHYKILLMKRVKPTLDRKTFEDLSTALLSRVIDDQIAMTKKGSLSPNTVKRILGDLRHFLQWCQDQGYIDALPKFPKVNGVASRRPDFDPTDWRKLTRQLQEYVKIENRAVRRDRMMLRDYVLILANTGIRTGEARTLKWRDIEEISGPDGTSNFVLRVSGKTGKREVIARSSEVKTYFRRIRDLRIAELTTPENPNPTLGPDGLIFCHKDGSEIGSFKKSFMSLLKFAKVERDSHGDLRSIYSLRHTYATFRLHNGVSVYTLARNMGTSVAMIEQHYGHTSNVASADELTKHSGRRQNKATTLNWLD
ncbi:MAG TPA: tyrosine-type recombinase/integrase [Sphingomonas sp.]